MAKFYPPTIDEDAPSGEVDLWRQLEALPDSYMVLWTWHFLKQQGGIDIPGECDFIVITPKHGVIAIEAKGGNVTWHDNAYWQGPRRKRPHEQASDAAYAINDAILAAGVRKVPVRWALAFTDTAPWDELPHHVTEGQIMFAPQTRASRIAQSLAKIVSTVDPVRGDRGESSVSQGAILGALAPRLQAEFASELVVTETRLNAGTMVGVKATGGQVEALAAMQSTYFPGTRSRVAVYGPAGSGKTVLAMHRAQEAAAADPEASILLLSPSGQLQRLLLTTKLDPSKIEIPRNVYIHDIASLLAKVAADLRSVGAVSFLEALGNPPLRRNRGQSHAELRADQALWLGDAALELPSKHAYNMVIVDEAQDFDHDMIAVLELLADRDGHEGPIVLLADPRQRMLSGDPWTMPPKFYPVTMTHNLRNTAAIAAVVARVNPDVQPAPADWAAGAEPVYVEVKEGTSASALVPALVKAQLDAQVPARDIVVLAAGRRTDTIVDALRRGGIAAGRLGDDARAGRNRERGVVVTGAQDFKGREATVSVVVLGKHSLTYTPGDEDDEVIRTFRSQAYVALSRARGHLTVLGTPEQLDVLDPGREIRDAVPTDEAIAARAQ